MMGLFDHFGEERSLKELRGRQVGVIDQIAEAVREGHKRIIVQAPTGAGKTVLAAHLMKRSADKGCRPIFIAPAIALVEQTLRSFETQGLRDIGIIQAQHHRTDFRAQIQIASRDTLIRRQLPEIHMGCIDEVHDERDALNERLNSEAWKDKVFVGFSATPWSKGLGLRWTKLIVMATMAQMIYEGYLTPFRVFGPAEAYEPNMSKVGIVAGDFNEGQTSRVMSDDRLIGDAVDTWLRHRQEGNHPGDRTFLYGVNCAHAKSLMEAFKAKDVPCGYIDGDSPPEERLRTFARYRNREDKVLCNVGVLVTGVDEDVRCLIDCVPTRSQIKHVQRWGRGARLADGKEYCLALDHAGNCMRDGLGYPWDIHHDTLDTRKPSEKGDAYEGEKPAPKPRKCGNCHAVIPAKTRVCPACGDAYTAPNTVEHIAGELVEMGALPKQLKMPKPKISEEQAFYSGFLQMAERRGFKDGWASMKFKEKFGKWPNGLEKRPMTPRKAVKEFAAESHKRYLAAKHGATQAKVEAIEMSL